MNIGFFCHVCFTFGSGYLDATSVATSTGRDPSLKAAKVLSLVLGSDWEDKKLYREYFGIGLTCQNALDLPECQFC